MQFTVIDVSKIQLTQVALHVKKLEVNSNRSKT